MRALMRLGRLPARRMMGLLLVTSVAGCGGGGASQPTSTPPPVNDNPVNDNPVNDNPVDNNPDDRTAFRSCVQVPPIEFFSTGTESAPSSRRQIQATTGITLSGTISAAAGSAVDADVNDPLAAEAGNDAFGNAQDIGNPITVGGYLNAPGAGPPGISRSRGDLSDFYRANLLAGQKITLNIADAVAGDLDVCLFDSDGRLIDASVNVGQIESIPIADDGTYFIEVHVFAGASNYVLALGQELTAQVDGLRLRSDFVAGETRMQWRQAASAPAARRQAAASVGLRTAGDPHPRWQILRFDNPADAGLRRQALGAMQAEASVAGPGHPAAAAGLAAEWDTLMAIKTLRRRDDVLFAEPNYRLRPLAVPNDANYALQWHYPLIELPQAWDLLPPAAAAAQPVVAVIDTGIVSAHPDLDGRLIAGLGFDFISDPRQAADGDSRDANPEDPGDQSPGGSSFHGTHVAGTIAAATDNGIGVAGIAWRTGTRIMSLRALGVGGGTSTDVDDAILYAAGLDGPTPVAPRADVINLSLGGPDISETSRGVLDEAIARGVIVIAAAGNEATSAPSYPAAHGEVISVSAVGPGQALAFYSNFGPSIDVAAPGGDNSRDRDGDGFADGVLSTAASDTSGSILSLYTFQNGTSMATPHVAGVAALMKAVDPALTHTGFLSLLRQGRLTDDIGEPGRDDAFGYGLINARKAVQAALDGGTPAPARLLAVSSALNLGAVQSTAELRLRNVGGEALSLTGISTDQTWLSAAPLTATELAANEQITIALTADRSTLAEGSHRAVVSVQASSNSVSVPVLIQVGETLGADDAGYHYVLLIDMATDDVLVDAQGRFYQDAVAAIGGQYAFSFTDVPPGHYQIVAGTDANNDGFICDAGEACGAYIALDQPITLTVDAEDQTGLDFVTGYQISLQLQAQSSATRASSRRYPIQSNAE